MVAQADLFEIAEGDGGATLASEADMDDPEDFTASESEPDDEDTMIEEEVRDIKSSVDVSQRGAGSRLLSSAAQF